MKKKYNVNKKRIFILISIIIIAIFEVVALKKSMADRTIQLDATIIDESLNVPDKLIKLDATNISNKNYELTLPVYIDNIKVDSYIIIAKDIHSEETVQNDVKEIEQALNFEQTENTQENELGENTEGTLNNLEENAEQLEKKENSYEQHEQIEDSLLEYVQIDDKVIMLPGETIYLTDTEVEEKAITLKVIYDFLEKDNINLYAQRIETEVDDNDDGTIDGKITIEGYMPLGAEIFEEALSMEAIGDTIIPMLSEKVSFKKAYDIKILYNEQEYEPTDFDLNVKVMISGVDEIDENNQSYKVVHIDNQNNIEEVSGVQIVNDTITFPADRFSTYALLLDDNTTFTTTSLLSNSPSIWEGDTANNFRYGEGNSNNPYLITSAKELSYLAIMVNNGEDYDGIYFELITDIDLNSRTWTPIGTYENSFKGVFNGGGHTIANATISLPTTLPTSISSYGIFGSIGNGSNKTVIKNLEIDNITIELNANGTTANNTTAKGYNIGIVTGTIYNKAEIKNVIVNNCTILDNYTMTIRTNSTQLFVGGIAGLAVNSSNFTSDPGEGNRYAIENCYANVDVDLDTTTRNISSAGQYNVGGIVGLIRGQAVWPENCLYRGTLDATKGLTGPIFGALRGNTSLGTSVTQLNTLWQGNDLGNLTMNSYYTAYSTNGYSFSNSVQSGTSTSRAGTSTYNIRYVQGLNKGLYTNNLGNMLSNFNDYVATNSDNGYLTWHYDEEETEYYFTPEITVSVERNIPNYTLLVTDTANTGTYSYVWIVDDELQADITGNTLYMESDWENSHTVEVLVSNGQSYAMVYFTIETLELHINFNMNNINNVLTGSIAGTGTIDPNFNIDDYTYQWYKLDISGTEEILEGEISNVISNLENGMEYKIVAINNNYPYMNVEGTFLYGTRTVIYVSYYNGNNNNDGFTPTTPVATLAMAYSKFSSNTTRNENVIVIMGTYATTSILNSATATTYAKNVTITGKYQGVEYNGLLYFDASSRYKYLNGNTTFMHITFDGRNSRTYFYLQGYDLTMGEGIVMQNYLVANTNQGLIEGNAPGFHIFAGWLQYDYTSLPRTNGKIVIKSGTYARILLGGSPGTSGVSNLTKYNSHNFMGTSLTDDLYKSEITIDIKNSTTSSNYEYDINLLGGGSTCGNIYGDVTLNIKNGTIGRLLGASIGDSGERPNNWQYPLNTYIGTATINMTGGTVTEMYGGCLGRNMQAIDGYDTNPIKCDSYFYGTVNINISGGIVNQTIYGAGAGGVSGYNENSTDVYKSYGESINTAVNINISGGTIDADIYGGGYGYTNYLTANSTQVDGGTLYGDSYINISGSPTINGNIYGAGRGYDLASDKPDLAQMVGNSNITITGNPNILGKIYGAGMGLSEYSEMAKLIGTSTTNINADLAVNVYGGGNIAKTLGNTYIHINEGEHLADIYGGGNVGIINGTSYVEINGGVSNNIYGGGHQAGVNNTIIDILGGESNTVYGGSNESGDVETTTINVQNGVVGDIFGGNNQGGTCNETHIEIYGGNVTGAIYGGGNEVATENTEIIMQNTTNTIPYIFGGGKAADVKITNITINAGTADKIFGGSNTNGVAQNTFIQVNNGNINSIYGGNNEGGTTNNSNIVVDNGNIANVFGGGNQANTTTSNVIVNNGNINEVYGGANQADIETTNVTINGGEITNVFGGSNQSGTVTNANVILQSLEYQETSNLTIYGGNNLGGTTLTSNVIAIAGSAKDIYGGGNQAVTNAPNVTIQNDAQILGSVYGGGNQAGIETNTNVNILGGVIKENIYGGGNQGIVTGSTYVHIKDATINGSAYAGGNGITAIVFTNVNITVDGTNTNILENVFGGGNQAATGTEINNNSLSTVNIAGGNIGGNVYGGANTSVVYGNTLTNIGYNAVGDETLTKGDIVIAGTVFGGGEANASGSEIYDFAFISVTVGIDINVNGEGHDKCQIRGSIFGSGNASSTSGYSNININNYGTIDIPQRNISIQRADVVIINNSSIILSGAKDRTNEYSDVEFTFSRIDEIKLKNNSTIYLDCGSNLLKKFTSCVDQDGEEVKATVTIDEESGEITKNVDNRLYMLEGKNLNIATNEQVTAYGEVIGMTFFGLYTNATNPTTSTGLYNREYENGDEITNAGTFSTNSYVRGLHKANHDITIDGFYSNYDNKENPGYIKTQYIETSPKDDVYYIWLIGVDLDITTYEVSLTASKYATLGAYELGLAGFSEPNIRFSLIGFSAGLIEGISLVDYNQIESVALDEETANTVFGLTMKTGNNGWMNKNTTSFLTENGGSYSGAITYNGDNSNFTPSLNLCLYHSENITIAQNLGSVRIRLQAQIPIDDLNVRMAYIDIIITMSTALYQNDFYEAAIAPGEEFSLFTTTETNITDSSKFTTYYSLFIPEFSESDYYEGYVNYNHVLVSRTSSGAAYAFPHNTKITMLDMATNKHYYYVVSLEDEQAQKYVYNLEDFLVMGSDATYYDEQSATQTYYNNEQDLIYENFIFHIDFSENYIPTNIYNNSLLMELRDEEGQTLIGVLGIQRDTMLYSVYKDKDASINVTAVTDKNIVYRGNSFVLSVTTNFLQDIVESKMIYDTQFFEEKMGIKITMYDNNGNQLNSDSLLGVSFELNGIKYYPRIDGTTRICTADRVTNVLSKITIDTANNTVLATGDYTIKIESFGSPDGIYYGIQSSDVVEVGITIIESTYGLKVYTDDNSKFVEKEKGFTGNKNNDIVLNIDYSSVLSNPNMTISLYRRNYDTIYAQGYELVNLSDYLLVPIADIKSNNEYILNVTLQEHMTYTLDLAQNLTTGTYKIVIKIYDGEQYIGETFEYMIIK